MKRLLIGLWVLNLIDAISTAFLVSCGFASEANPLLAVFILHSPVLFFIVKMLIITSCLFVLWQLHNHAWVKIATVVITTLYSVLFMWHAVLWHNALNHLDTAQCIETAGEYEFNSQR